MKKIIKLISAFVGCTILLASCERVDLEGIGELNKVELWYGPYSNDADPLPEDSVLIDHVEKDLGIYLKAVPLPEGKDAQTEMIMEAAKKLKMPNIRKPDYSAFNEYNRFLDRVFKGKEKDVMIEKRRNAGIWGLF